MERESQVQAVLGLYSTLATVLTLFGGFVYTSLVGVMITPHLADKIVVVRCLLWTFTAFLATFMAWHYSTLPFTPGRPDSIWADVGNILFLMGIAGILISAYVLVRSRPTPGCWEAVWLSVSLGVLVIFSVCAVPKFMRLRRLIPS